MRFILPWIYKTNCLMLQTLPLNTNESASAKLTSKGFSPFETITLSRNLYFRRDGGLFLPAFDRSTSLFIPDVSTFFIPYSLKSRKGSLCSLKRLKFPKIFLCFSWIIIGQICFHIKLIHFIFSILKFMNN